MSQSRDLSYEKEEVFRDFTWTSHDNQENLRLNEAGFFESESGDWLMVRRASCNKPLDEVEPQDLFMGKGKNYYNATQGAGLYFTNTTSAATNVMYAARAKRQPQELFVARLEASSPDSILDTTNHLTGRKIRQHIGAGTVRAMALIPGMPWPTPTMYDYFYGEVDAVITKPSAMQRYNPGLRERLPGETIPARYAVIRNLGAISVIGHRSLAT